ncbi:MAG: hypothetical protein KDA85_02725 [Planctomycetaceae bacterium]|nr:hypothetical protein [Planctomycetaceae bacterium]
MRCLQVCPACLLLSAVLLCGCQQPPSSPAQSIAEQLFGTDGEPLAVAHGKDYRWEFSTAGPDGMLSTEDDVLLGEVLQLPPHQRVRLQFTSADYIYTFQQKELGINQVAVPGVAADAVFMTPENGVYEVSASPLCGFMFLHADYHPRIQIGLAENLP